MLDQLREGDVVVWKPGCLSRSLKDVLYVAFNIIRCVYNEKAAPASNQAPGPLSRSTSVNKEEIWPHPQYRQGNADCFPAVYGPRIAESHLQASALCSPTRV
jgi:hypothetical protein